MKTEKSSESQYCIGSLQRSFGVACGSSPMSATHIQTTIVAMVVDVVGGNVVTHCTALHHPAWTWPGKYNRGRPIYTPSRHLPYSTVQALYVYSITCIALQHGPGIICILHHAYCPTARPRHYIYIYYITSIAPQQDPGIICILHHAYCPTARPSHYMYTTWRLLPYSTAQALNVYSITSITLQHDPGIICILHHVYCPAARPRHYIYTTSRLLPYSTTQALYVYYITSIALQHDPGIICSVVAFHADTIARVTKTHCKLPTYSITNTWATTDNV